MIYKLHRLSFTSVKDSFFLSVLLCLKYSIKTKFLSIHKTVSFYQIISIGNFIKALNIIGKWKDLIYTGSWEVKHTAFETGELEEEIQPEKVQAAIMEKRV